MVTASIISSWILAYAAGLTWKQVSDKAHALFLTASVFIERRMGVVAYPKVEGLKRPFSQCGCELYHIPAAKKATNQPTNQEK